MNKKVNLNNITTEVPEHAERITNPEDLSIGDYILIVHDVPKERWICGIEKNHRSVAQVTKTITVKGNPFYGRVNHKKDAKALALAKQNNALYSSHGTFFLKEDSIIKVFKIDSGAVRNPATPMGISPGNTNFDLMC